MIKFKIAAAVAACFLLQSQSFAGSTDPQQVVVGSTFAYGALNGARNSADSTQLITCGVSSDLANQSDPTSTATSDYLSCYASDVSGNVFYCYINTAPQTWIKLVAALNKASFLSVFADSSGHCLGISTNQGSEYL